MADDITVTDNTPTAPNVMSSITSSDGMTVESNHETPEELREHLGLEETPAEPEPTSRRRKNRHSNQYIAVSEAKGRAKEAERLAAEATEKAAKLAAEIEELKKPKPAPVVQPSVPQQAPPPPLAAHPASPAAQPQAPPTQAEYKRYMAMPDAPKMADFTGESAFEEWQWAVNTFVADKRFAENMQRMQRGQQIAQQQTQITTRLNAEIAKDPTFQQKFDATPVDTRIIPYLHAHKQGAEVMVFLVNHQDIAQELASLQPDLRSELPSAQQIERIGEIVGLIKAQSAAAPVPASARPAISTAKPPTKRVVGAPLAATDEPPGDDVSEAEHEAYWGPRRTEFRSARRRHR